MREGSMEFFKYHSLGNDFVVLDALDSPVRLAPEEIRMLCHRHLGIGADGIILIEPSTRATCRMTNYNPDASEADVSGNGLRCLAKHLFDTERHADTRMSVETPSGIKEVLIRPARGKAAMIQVNMGVPDFRCSSIPMTAEGEEAVDFRLEIGDRELEATCLSMGTPHCVLFLEDLDPSQVRELGPAIENHPLFPLRVNVEFAQVVDMSDIRMRSWERGAGETLASAAGAAAVVAAALRTGRCKRTVHVQMPGGLMEVRVNDAGEVLTLGPARRVFRGTLDPDWRERSRVIIH